MKKTKIFFALAFIFSLVMLYKKVLAIETLPDNGAVISSAEIIQTKTGTAPWDDDDEPGNDSSEDNDIVRSFDQVTWTIENTMALNTDDASSYTGGKIIVKLTLPESAKGIVRWDADSMGWAESSATLSDDGLVFTGEYNLSTEDTTVPGKQTLVFVAKVEGATNGYEIEPTFEVKLNGNDDSTKKTITPDKVMVSSKPSYNIRLQSREMRRVNTLNIDGEDQEGIVYAYLATLQLYNTSSSKGMKGIEYPTGDFAFDIKLDLDKYDKSGNFLEDITETKTPVIFNYSTDGNNNLNSAAYKDRTFYNFWQAEVMPFNNRPYYTQATKEQRERYVYKSGNSTITQEGDTLHVIVSDYDFDGVFPNKNNGSTDSATVYTSNVGCFSTVCFQLFTPISELTADEECNYYITTSVDGIDANGKSGANTSEDLIKTDNTLRRKVEVYLSGSYYKHHQFFNYNMNLLSSTWNSGDSYAAQEQVIYLAPMICQSKNNDPVEHACYGANVLFKFDDKAFNILSSYKGQQFRTDGWLTFQMFYAAKKDGTGWVSNDEQDDAKIEDLDYYESLDELKADGKVCVGALFESTGGAFKTSENQGGNLDKHIFVPVQISTTSNIGQTYQYTTDVRVYKEAIDRTKESVKYGVDSYTSTPIFSSVNNNYIKTEYDENGQMVKGTHSSSSAGNSLLVVGAKIAISNEVTKLDENNSKKVNYDISRNENEVEYKLLPTLTNNYIDSEINNVTLTVKDTLPVGLKYKAGSANYGEPEIITNSNGSTTLIWNINNCTVNKEIDPIIFTAEIDQELANGTQLETKAVVESAIDTSLEMFRTETETIQITNLSSHRLYKIVDTPVVEKNEEIHFTVSYKNNTDTTIPNFQLLDILPYNGDSRGTSFNGTYTLDRLVVTQEDTDGNTLSNDNLTILYTNNESARSANSKDTNLGENWTEIQAENINQAATAFCVKGEVGSQGKVTVDIYLKPNGNKGLDKYINSATAQVYTNTEEMQTSNVIAQVIQRKLEGIAWLDNNANGVQDSDEEVVKNIDVTLTDENGEQVKDVDGEVISSVKTDENGYYSFVDLPKGKYYVKVSLPSDKYMLTEKQVGSNTTINSKFNVESSETDEITKLNTADLPELTVSNVNAGYVKKPTKVVVNHVEVGTNTKLLDEETIDGRIDDSYETTNKLDEVNEKYSNKYKYTSVDGNETGTMTEDTIYITYYYEKVYGSLKITKVDKNNNETKIQGATYKLENDEGYSKELTTDENGEVLFDSLEIGKYTLTETKAPSGYELEGKSKEIEITQANKDVEVIASDRLRIVLPDTGRINYTVAIILSGIVIVSISILLKNKKKLK